MLNLLRSLFLLGLFVGMAGALRAGVPLQLGPRHDLKVTPVSPGVFDLEVTGPSPHFWSEPIPLAFDPAEHTVVSFEYFSPSGVDAFSLRYRRADGKMVFGGSGPVPLAETWQPFSIDFSGAELLPTKGEPKSRFHFSLKYRPDVSLRIRNLKVRARNAAEIQAAEGRAERRAFREADAEVYLDYLRKEYRNRISKVVVSAEKITVDGVVGEPLHLKELAVHVPSHQAGSLPIRKIEAVGGFSVEIDRFAAGSGKRDRGLSRWRLENAKGEIVSACRWPDAVADGVARELKVLSVPHQKGLGGIPDIADAEHEIFELGIGHATLNLVLNAVISKEPKRGWKPRPFEGQRYFVNEKFLRARDRTVRSLRQKGIIVTCILLVGNKSGDLMTHPDAQSRGTFAMPNLETEQGAKLYRAAFDLLTDHFARDENRITNWVIHNEIDQAGTWTNMGDQPLARYLETYIRSARIVYHSAKLRDPHARVFVSLTHHWAKKSTGEGVYRVRDIIDLFGEAAEVEGTFDWGVAYHPYPQNLRNPDTWDDADVTFDFDTPYITPKNLEVLPAYLGDRPILLSEQGFNTPTLSEADQKRQVAGLIYLFRKLPKFPTIEAFHLHRYRDMPDREGGLRLGIIDENGNRKLGWDAYAAIGSDTGALEKFEEIADSILPEGERGELREISPPEEPK